MLNPEIIKTSPRYLYYRIYAVIAIILWNTFCLSQFPDFKKIYHPDPKTVFIYILFSVVLLMPLFTIMANLAIFPFKYGILGPNVRTPFPQEQPVFVQKNTWGRIGWFSGRGMSFTMRIFSSGLGISFFGGAKVFIPKENISSIGNEFLMGYKLMHDSPQLRNPVVFSSKENFDKMRSVFHI